MTMHVPGPRWSDLIYKIAEWFARDEKLPGEIADRACQDGRASPSLSVTSSLPSPSSATRADWRRTKFRFGYPVKKGDIDWRRLESAVLGEGLEGEYDCARLGNRGGISGGGNDESDEMLMRINPGAGGTRRLAASSLWVEVGNGSAVLGEVRGELGRLDKLGLLQVSCR